MKIVTSNDAKKKWSSYRPKEKAKLQNLRTLITDAARECDIETLEETLKWGELSYLTSRGSTIRIDTREKKSGDYAIYFKCTSALVPTFKKLHGSTFTYEKNRAILFDYQDNVPTKKLKACMKLALRYHEVKHLKFLGAKSTSKKI